MQTRPKIDIALSTEDKVLESTALLLLLALWGLVLYRFPRLPEIIPIHYNAAGHPDGYGRKASLFLLPLLATLLLAGLTALNRYPHIFNYPVTITPENAGRHYALATRMIRCLKLAIMLIFIIITYKIIQSAGHGSGRLGAWLLPLVLAIILAPVLFFIFRMSSPGKDDKPDRYK
jgi:uncharacterized membrane protein